jgi:predicted transcriptional regulator
MGSQMVVKPTTVRLDEGLTRDLDALAATTERPRAWHIEQAIRRYLADEAWQVEAIREALLDYRAAADDVVSHDDVMDRLEARIRSASTAS